MSVSASSQAPGFVAIGSAGAPPHVSLPRGHAVPPELSGAQALATAGSVGSVAAAAALVLFGARAAKAAGRAQTGKRSRRSSRVVVNNTAAAESSFNTTVLPKVDRSTTKAFRKNLMQSDQYFRFSKTQMEDAMNDLIRSSGSELLTKMRENGFRLTIGDVTFVLAESYGFCWGVERTLAMAYEANKFFPDKSIWVTNEIIHNAVVNRNLKDVGMKFVPKASDGSKDFSGINEGDVVILPAFGASVDEMSYLKERKVQIVDTTCPWVSKVWNSVEKAKDKEFTTIIHGKYAHEETVATKSFADKYLIVKDMAEAEYAANYVLEGGSREEFMKKFAKSMSEGFDPDRDLEAVGVANQTTMLKGETELIGRLFERVMIRKYGPQNVNEHFKSFNTICDATQERQDAMYKMFGAEYEAPTSQLYAELEGEQIGIDLQSMKKGGKKLSSKAMEAESRGGSNVEFEAPGKVDLCLVIGGFNSSNTTHLIEIPEEQGVTTYHIDSAARIGRMGEGSIQHKPLSTPPAEAMMDQGLEVTENFLPEGPITIGITAGASTPDSSVGECLEKVLAIRGLRA